MITKLKTGDVINVHNVGIIPKLISKFIGSYCNHTACYIGDGLIIESHFTGVRVVPLFWHKDYTVSRHKTATITQLSDAVAYMLNRVGCKYDFLGLLGIGINMFLNRTKNSLDDKEKYWCSELIADGYINVGIETGFNKNTILISPADFVNNTKYFMEVK